MNKKCRNCFLFTLLLVIAIGWSEVLAQDSPQFGIKGGRNFSTLSDDDDFGFTTGGIIGVFVDINISSTPLSIQPEVLFSQYGLRINDSGVNIKLNYLQFPVLFKIGPTLSGTKPNVFFGPYVSLRTKAEYNYESVSTDIKEKTENTDFGLVLGAGIEVEKFRISVRYTSGSKGSLKGEFNRNSNNIGIALTLGVAF